MKSFTPKDIQQKRDAREPMYLIDTLSAQSFEARHVPGARSVPYAPDFVEVFEKIVGAPKDAEIITYCASSGCQLSVLAADALEKAGYTNVGHFVDGLAGWQKAGYPFEGSAA